MQKLAAALVIALSLACSASAIAQAPAAAPSSAPGKTYLLIPYDQPGGKDPHASPIMGFLNDDLTAANVSVRTAPAMDHLEAVQNAASLCAQYHADGLLIPEGRYEQTIKNVYAVLTTITKYPTHVEFRLDEISCNGAVNWSKTTSADRNTSGFSSSNLNAVIDDAFHGAVNDATAAFGQATIPAILQVSEVSKTPASPPPPLDPSAKYLVVPIGQPGLADPRASEIQHSFMEKLEADKISAVEGVPMDRLTVISSAKSLCQANGAGAILVPRLRIEQSSFDGDSFAELRLDVVGCDGTLRAKALGTADVKRGNLVNFGATAVDVSERATDAALTNLLHP